MPKPQSTLPNPFGKNIPKPLALFDSWFHEATAQEPNNPNAMALSTLDKRGRISSRMVLLKSYDKDGFVFFTNQDSDKGNAMTTNPKVALLFHWKSLKRQVRIEGKVSKVSKQESDDYFHSRPLDSQIGAWASLQSRPMPHADILTKRIAQYRRKFSSQIATGKIPRPPYWIGYRVIPNRFEFWQEQPYRLHYRLVYKKNNKNEFNTAQLYP